MEPGEPVERGSCACLDLPSYTGSRKSRARYYQLKGNQLSRKIDATTPPSLVVRLRDHSDSQAWAEFVDVYSPLIYNYCRWRELQSSDAADVTQEVLLRVAKAIRNFEYDRTKGLFRDWLARIVLNEIRRHTKKPVDTATAPNDLDQDPGLLESAWKEQFQQTVFAEALTRSQPHFTDDTWTMFKKSWLEKMPAEQLAAELGTSIDRIYVARSRVLKRLRFEVALLADDLPF